MRDKTIINTDKRAAPRRGVLSSTVMARVRPSLREGIASPRKTMSRWMAIVALLLTAGIVLATVIKEKQEAAGLVAIVDFLLSPTVKASRSRPSTAPAIQMTSRLRPRSSFETEAAFRASETYRTLLLAGRALPLAIHCKDVPALRAVKAVLGVITGNDPYYAELMARRYISQQPDQFRYVQRDCLQTLPKMMDELRKRA